MPVRRHVEGTGIAAVEVPRFEARKSITERAQHISRLVEVHSVGVIVGVDPIVNLCRVQRPDQGQVFALRAAVELVDEVVEHWMLSRGALRPFDKPDLVAADSYWDFDP